MQCRDLTPHLIQSSGPLTQGGKVKVSLAALVFIEPGTEQCSSLSCCALSTERICLVSHMHMLDGFLVLSAPMLH